MSIENSSATFAGVLKNKQFSRLWLAQFVSTFGDWLSLMALFSFVAFRLQGSAYQVSGIMTAFIIPRAFLAPVAGAFVDRWDVKKVMVTSDLLRAILALSLAFTSRLDVIYILVFALSIGSCFFSPAQTVAVRLIVRKEELLIANSINTQTTQLNKVISPAIAGLLLAWAGEQVCFIIDSASFILSATLLSITAMQRESIISGQGLRAIAGEIMEGLRFIRQHKGLLFVIVSMIVAIFAFGTCDVVFTLYVRDILLARSEVFGILVSLSGIGTILGAVLVVKIKQRLPKVHLITIGLLGIGVGVLVLAATSSVAVALLCALWIGVCIAYVMLPAQTLVQEETPQALLGRVSSTSSASITLSQLLAFAIAGIAASWMGVRNLYYTVGLIMALVAISAYLYARANHVAEAKGSTAINLAQ